MCKERRRLGNTFWKRVSSENESFNKNQRNECDTLWEICKKTCLEEVITKAIRNKILWKFKKRFLADKSSYE